MLSAVTFDVWNTLLKIDAVFSKLATTISVMKGLDPVDAKTTIYEVYKKTRELRLYIVDSDEVRSFPARSRQFLARTLGADVDDIKNAIEITFSSVDPSSLLYDDVKPALEVLGSMGISMGIIGNTVFWESIFTREILEKTGLRSYFRFQIYSDEIGFFKPDRRIFLEFCRRANVKPQQVVHVGDSVIEDIGGALSSGMKAMLIDRSSKKLIVSSVNLIITPTLLDLVEALQIFSS